MGLLFRNQRKPKGFNLKPRYYNERKEKLDNLRAKHDGKSDFETNREAYREQLHEAWSGKRNESGKGSGMRILIIFAILLLVAYQFLLK